MKTLLNIKTDKEVKEKAQRLAKELGLPLSAIINAQLKQLLRDRELQISAAPRMSKKLEEVIREAERDLYDKKTSPPFFLTQKGLSRICAPDEHPFS